MWYNLPATQMTPEIEQDMKIMKMRNILDRKRHYKKNDSSSLPKYFQVGWETLEDFETDPSVHSSFLEITPTNFCGNLEYSNYKSCWSSPYTLSTVVF